MVIMSTTKRYRVFRFTLLTTIIALIVQYVLGMVVNLSLQFPSPLSGTFPPAMLIQVHVFLGTLLLLLPLINLGLSIALKRGRSILISLLGFFLIFSAYVGGMLFLGGVQENASSLLMASGMMAALVVYGWEHYLTRSTVSPEIRPARA